MKYLKFDDFNKRFKNIRKDVAIMMLYNLCDYMDQKEIEHLILDAKISLNLQKQHDLLTKMEPLGKCKNTKEMLSWLEEHDRWDILHKKLDKLDIEYNQLYKQKERLLHHD